MAATFTDEERHRLIALLLNDIGKTQLYVFPQVHIHLPNLQMAHELLIVVSLIISPRHLQHHMENVLDIPLLNYLMEGRPKLILLEL